MEIALISAIATEGYRCEDADARAGPNHQKRVRIDGYIGPRNGQRVKDHFGNRPAR